jgi:hypothetical protein
VWPKTPEYLMQGFQEANVPDGDIDKMTHANAMRAYRFDPFSALGRDKCTVGALRAKAAHVDTEPRSQAGNRPTAADDHRRVTSGDVVKLFQANKGEAA